MKNVDKFILILKSYEFRRIGTFTSTFLTIHRKILTTGSFFYFDKSGPDSTLIMATRSIQDHIRKNASQETNRLENENPNHEQHETDRPETLNQDQLQLGSIEVLMNPKQDPILLGIHPRPGKKVIFNEKSFKVISPFAGKYLDFPIFWSQFAALVGITDIPQSLKLGCLKSKLKGEAFTFIDGYTDYEHACKRIIEHYGDPFFFKIEAERMLQKTPAALSEWDYDALRMINNSLAKTFSMGHIVQDIDFIQKVKAVVLKKLPTIVTQKTPYFTQQNATLKDLLNFLDKNLDGLRNSGMLEDKMKEIANKQGPSLKVGGSKLQSLGSKQRFHMNNEQQPSGTTKVFRCGFCYGDHQNFLCNSNQSSENRYRIAITKHLCTRCCNPKHTAKECKRMFKCRKCQGNHLELICSGQIMLIINEQKMPAYPFPKQKDSHDQIYIQDLDLE